MLNPTLRLLALCAFLATSILATPVEVSVHRGDLDNIVHSEQSVLTEYVKDIDSQLDELDNEIEEILVEIDEEEEEEGYDLESDEDDLDYEDEEYVDDNWLENEYPDEDDEEEDPDWLPEDHMDEYETESEDMEYYDDYEDEGDYDEEMLSEEEQQEEEEEENGEVTSVEEDEDDERFFRGRGRGRGPRKGRGPWGGRGRGRGRGGRHHGDAEQEIDVELLSDEERDGGYDVDMAEEDDVSRRGPRGRGRHMPPRHGKGWGPHHRGRARWGRRHPARRDDDVEGRGPHHDHPRDGPHEQYHQDEEVEEGRRGRGWRRGARRGGDGQERRDEDCNGGPCRRRDVDEDSDEEEEGRTWGRGSRRGPRGRRGHPGRRGHRGRHHGRRRDEDEGEVGEAARVRRAADPVKFMEKKPLEAKPKMVCRKLKNPKKTKAVEEMKKKISAEATPNTKHMYRIEFMEQIMGCCDQNDTTIECMKDLRRHRDNKFCDEDMPLTPWKRRSSKKLAVVTKEECCQKSGDERHACFSRTKMSAAKHAKMAKRQRKMARKAGKEGGVDGEEEMKEDMDEAKMSRKERRQQKKEKKMQKKMARQERRQGGKEEKKEERKEERKERRGEKRQMKGECCNLGREVAEGLTAEQSPKDECKKAAGETELVTRGCKIAFKKCCLKSKGPEAEAEMTNKLAPTV